MDFSLGSNVWKTERRLRLGEGLKKWMSSQEVTGQWNRRALEVGELARLLDRKGWRGVVLNESVILVCGLDDVLWEVFTAVSRDRIQPVKCTKKVVLLLSITVPIPIAFP